MDESVKGYIEIISVAIEWLGILILVTGLVLSMGKYIFKLQKSNHRSFQALREDIGRSILLGLEILIAADIIATVFYGSSTEQILNLGLIILIRSFLSFTLEVEIEGKLPWKQNDNQTTGKR